MELPEGVKVTKEHLAWTVDLDDISDATPAGKTPENSTHRVIKVDFHKPRKKGPNKSLYTIGAINRQGVLIKIPLENQINNQIASDTGFTGLSLYTRKGFRVLFDEKLNEGVFCPGWDCYAAWNPDNFGYCGAVCGAIQAKVTGGSLFSQGATTSQNVFAKA